MRIEVTAQDIASGARCHCRRCPVALAIQRATNDPNAFAGFGRIRVHGRELQQWPEAVANFVGEFDRCLPVQPFAFDLDLEATA